MLNKYQIINKKKSMLKCNKKLLKDRSKEEILQIVREKYVTNQRPVIQFTTD